MHESSITWIMACYNYAHTLERALRSILRSAAPSDRVIVIDDGSKDDSWAVAQAAAKADPRVSAITQPNAGPGAARNAGLQLVTTPLFSFLDADDELMDEALPQVRAAFADKELDAVFCTYVSISQQGKLRQSAPPVLDPSPSRRFLDYISRKTTLPMGTGFFRSSSTAHWRFPENIRSNEDLVYLSRFLVKHRCAALAVTSVKIHHHADSLRHDIRLVEAAGCSPVDLIFDPSILGPELMRHRSVFLANRCLSISRALILSGECAKGRAWYGRALRERPLCLLRLGYLVKVLRTLHKN